MQTAMYAAILSDRLRVRLAAIAASDASVLITGESGTGKELAARAIHEGSERASGPFVALSCAAFPDTLLEEEMFGHERGAFTGAVKSRIGRFGAAHRGTLFLDEVAELSPAAQAKLLRVLQERTYEPIGTNTPIKVDVRVISATHRDLRALIEQGRFREDLYYRLKVLDMRLPPLRERREELATLADEFLRRYAKRAPPPELSPRAWAVLWQYPFPGNVRELEHAIQHAIVMAEGRREIELEHLPAEIASEHGLADGEETGGDRAAKSLPLAAAVKEFEREYLARILARCDGVRGRAAELLGISRKTLWEKLIEHGITRRGRR